MSLRIKLTLFTVCFVLMASVAILAVSVFQIRQKEQRDIDIFRSNELHRLRNNLRKSVTLICSGVENHINIPEKSTGRTDGFSYLKKNFIMGTTDWIWVLDTGSVGQPALVSITHEVPVSRLPNMRRLFDAARDSGEAILESSVPETISPGSPSTGPSHLLWYARTVTPEGWILAAAAPLTDLDSTVAERTNAISADITRMIKDRMLFALLLMIACAVAIIWFSGLMANPVNRLVRLTESIVAGEKDVTDRITVTSNDEIGRLAASFNAMLDHVTESMHQLETTAGKYRELVENANSVIIHIDKNGSVLFVNEYALRLFGYSAAEVEGKNITETIGKPVENQRNGKDMFLAPEKYPYLEREHLTHEGTRIWVGWTNRPLLDTDRHPVETLCIGSDITKSKESEELAALQQRKLVQADKMATLGILVSGVAHEINNPNNYIILNSQLLQSMWGDIAPVLDAFSNDNPDYAVAGLAYRELAKEIPGLLGGITDGALRIKRIVQNLKDFSRMEPDDVIQKIDIVKVLEAAQVILSNMIKKSTNDFRVTIGPAIPPVLGNFQRLEQVVINLLTNACQATDDPAKPIVINIAHRQSSNDVVLTINDNGYGISNVDMQRIFDPFFTTKRDEGGTGLGLAISFSIIKDHGGDLRLESVAGHGTTAILTLPAA